MSKAAEVWITGAGLASSLGEGLDAHWDAIEAGKPPVLDGETYAPYRIHPMAALDLDKQIAKKLDQRQMEAWQRYGTYAAGLALENAGLKGVPELLANTQMVVAAGGGERDAQVDGAVLAGLREASDRGRYLNERLMSDLRPTLFLAQLSNLLAGNIAIVHGVIGASRTFMGEESAGIDAVRVAHARIAAGQGDTFLVGGSLSAARWDLPLLFEMGGYLRTEPFAPVAMRETSDPGFYLGSMGAFLVAENAETAQKRGRTPLAKLSAVVSDRGKREPGGLAASLEKMWGSIAGRLKPGKFAILSGATGAAGITLEEFAALKKCAPDAPIRAIGNLIGHGVEAQFPAGILLGAMALSRGALWRPTHDDATETPYDGEIEQIVVTGVGHWRGEGLALVEKV